MMILFIKSVAVGLLGAVVLWLVAMFTALLPLLWRMRSSGSGGIGAVSVGFFSFGPLVITLIGFLIGFVWMFRRG